MVKKKKRVNSAAKSASRPNFEQALAELEQIVLRLEDGQLGLSEALECYEKGVAHLKQCYQSLQDAERKIELLTGVDEDGTPTTVEFDDPTMSLEEKAEKRDRRRSMKRTGKAKKPGDSSGVDLPGSLF